MSHPDNSRHLPVRESSAGKQTGDPDRRWEESESEEGFLFRTGDPVWDEQLLLDECVTPASDEAHRQMVRFRVALVVYILLAGLAGLTLTGSIRIATLIFLAGLALKSYLAVLKSRSEE